jgi:hypothetical protein
MPALHSIITVNGREIGLEAIAAEPALTVNARAVRTALLHDGDRIGIGEVELLARLEAGHPPAEAQTATPSAAAIDENRPVSELSAAELVDLIEQEERAVEDFESRQRVGEDALVAAVLGRARRRGTERPVETGVRAPIPAPHFLSKRPQILVAQTHQSEIDAERDPQVQKELEELGQHLSTLSDQMKGNSKRASEREAQYVAAADVLLETQQKLVSQLEVLVDQVESLKTQETPVTKPRAIA